MITFGIIEILFSQIPDFDQVWWLSIVAAIMSFTYSTVGLGLGIGKVAGIQKKLHHCDSDYLIIHYLQKQIKSRNYFSSKDIKWKDLVQA